jgi:hypothetical protein
VLENEIEVAVFSMAARSETGDDAAYLEWHLLDHQPEQYQIRGLRHGQRWASTPACRAARAAASDRFAAVDHLTQYLFDDPVDQGLDDFLDLGADLRRRGRYPHRLPSVLLANFDLIAARAAPRVLVSAGVLPFRPNRGAYLILEADASARVAEAASDELEELIGVDGVAGAWVFAPGQRRADRFDAAGLSLTLCYLDDEPVAVAERLAPLLAGRWQGSSIAPALAAPFETVRPWEWDRSLP